MTGWFLALALAACTPSGPSVPPPASSLPGPYQGLRLPLDDAEVAPDDDGLRITYATPELAWKDLLATYDRGLTADGWTLNTSGAIPGGGHVEYLKGASSLSILAGGKPGKVSVYLEID